MIHLAHVEDDADIREIVLMALNFRGQFKVTQYASGDEALEHLEDAPPDVVLLDIMMPGLNGYEALQQMRKMPALSTVPVIFMTAHTPDPTLQKWCEQVDIDVIQKPIDPLALSDQILNLLEKMRSQYA